MPTQTKPQKLIYTSPSSWYALWSSHRLRGNCMEAYVNLTDRYAENWRRYHTLRHIEWVLRELNPLTPQMQYPAEVNMAIWFHDAIYIPDSKYNENFSAQLAVSVLGRAGMAADKLDRIANLIMATRHFDRLPQTIDEQILVDADLASLGYTPEVFDRNDSYIREEYCTVMPAAEYAIGRRKAMIQLHTRAERSKLYFTDYFREKYAAQAIANLRRAVSM